MESQSLPHTEVIIRIFGDGTPEYVLVKAPCVILIIGLILEGWFYTKQVSTLILDAS